LEGEPSFRVVGEAADGFEVVSLARKLLPDILLLDLVMPRAPVLSAASLLRPWGVAAATRCSEVHGTMFSVDIRRRC